MTWSSNFPNGNVSVKANEAIGQGNTTYTETKLGKQVVGTNTTPQTAQDHFWDIDANLDGRHRMINLPKFTVGGAAADPVRADDCDGVIYIREVNADVGRIEGFYQNSNGTYQFIPSFLSGTHVVTASFTNILAVPKNVYGEIFMYRTVNGETTGQAGFFKSNDTVCDCWSYGLRLDQVGTAARYNVRFGNGTDASGLNIRVIRDEASAGNTWEYRITYRAT